MSNKPSKPAKLAVGMDVKKPPTIRKVPPPQPGSKWRKLADGRIFVLMGYGLMETGGMMTNHAIYRDTPGGTIWLMEVRRFFKEFDLFKAAPPRKNVQKPKAAPIPGSRTFTNEQLAAMGEAGRLKKKGKLN